MKLLFNTALAAGLVLMSSAPATAQVNGIAVANPVVAFAQSRTRDTAFQQINQAYTSQIQLIGTLENEISTLQVSLDTNGDQQLTQAEVDANPAVVQQIQTKQQQIELAMQPIILAQNYALEQLITDYANAQSAVIAERGISLVLARDVLLYGPDNVDITAAIATKLDERQPTVQIAPPAGWQPRQATFNTYEQVQQLLIAAAQNQAARAAAQQGNGATAAPPVEGR